VQLTHNQPNNVQEKGIESSTQNFASPKECVNMHNERKPIPRNGAFKIFVLKTCPNHIPKIFESSKWYHIQRFITPKTT
jgi:hypothetical protein